MLQSLQHFFIQTAGLAYHHALACISSRHRRVYHHGNAVYKKILRFDDMQHFVLMICKSFGIDDIQGVRLDASGFFDNFYDKRIIGNSPKNAAIFAVFFYPNRRFGISSRLGVYIISP